MALVNVLGALAILGVIGAAWNSVLRQMSAQRDRLEGSVDQQALLHMINDRVDCEETIRRGNSGGATGVWGRHLAGDYYPIINPNNQITKYGDWRLGANTSGGIVRVAATHESPYMTYKYSTVLTQDLCSADKMAKDPYGNFRQKLFQTMQNVQRRGASNNAGTVLVKIDISCEPGEFLVGCDVGGGAASIVNVITQSFITDTCHLETTMNLAAQNKWIFISCLPFRR